MDLMHIYNDLKAIALQIFDTPFNAHTTYRLATNAINRFNR